MEYVLQSIVLAIEVDAMYPALLTALTVPDLAGSVAYPQVTSADRYTRWFNEWPVSIGHLKNMVDGHSVYAIRCRLLHEGTADMKDTRALARSDETPKLTDVAFRLDREGQAIIVQRRPNVPITELGTAQPNGAFSIEMSAFAKYPATVVWRVDEFCHLVVVAARGWLATLEDDPEASTRLDRLVREHTHVPGFDAPGRYVR